MELEAAVARIVELEGQVFVLTEERDAATGQMADLEAAHAALGGQLAETAGARDAVVGDLEAVRTTGLTYLRRALLAEHAGQLVPELVIGESEETLLASVEVAKGAYARALDTARAAIVRQTVPAGAPSARTAPTAGGLSPLELIESGLRR
jgi:hypothetical protein